MSLRAIRLIAYANRVAEVMQIAPVRFDLNKIRAMEVKRKKYPILSTWRLTTTLCIGLQVSLVVSYAYLCWKYSVPEHETVIMVCLSIFFSIVILIQHFYLTRMHEIELLINRFLMLDETFRKLLTFAVLAS